MLFLLCVFPYFRSGDYIALGGSHSANHTVSGYFSLRAFRVRSRFSSPLSRVSAFRSATQQRRNSLVGLSRCQYEHQGSGTNSNIQYYQQITYQLNIVCAQPSATGIHQSVSLDFAQAPQWGEATQLQVKVVIPLILPGALLLRVQWNRNTKRRVGTICRILPVRPECIYKLSVCGGRCGAVGGTRCP